MYEFMRSQINARRARSAWSKGVREYALELVDSLEERAQYEARNPDNIHEALRWALNGAMDWTQYSEGGCSLIYNRQIAERLCTASELRKTDNGRKDPNPSESWIDVQTRALYQAWLQVGLAFKAAQQFLPSRPESTKEPEEIPAF